MNSQIVERMSVVLGQRVTRWRPASGGYTAAERWVCALEDGGSAFTKVAVDARTAQWLREEYHVYQHVHAEYLPRVLGWDDHDPDRPILLLEDLSQSDWPPPWTQPRIDRAVSLAWTVFGGLAGALDRPTLPGGDRRGRVG